MIKRLRQRVRDLEEIRRLRQRVQDLELKREMFNTETESSTVVWDEGDDGEEHPFSRHPPRFSEPIYSEGVSEDEPRFDEDGTTPDEEECLFVHKVLNHIPVMKDYMFYSDAAAHDDAMEATVTNGCAEIQNHSNIEIEKFMGEPQNMGFGNFKNQNGENIGVAKDVAFRGHDESEESLYRGNFIEFLKVFGELSEEIGKVILGNAPGNNQMTSPSIQKELCNCFAEEVLKRIFEELNDDVFSILVDESRDISKKEQMAVVLRYVDKLGFVKERFIGLVHVMETTALSLKAAIDDLFARHNLSIGRVRGQGYDGASNMSVNVVGGSCKRIDLLRESQRESLGLNYEVETGSGKNQELSLARAGDTRWSSHEKTILRLLTLYHCVIDVLEYIEKSGEFSNYQNESRGLQEVIKTFNFVFYLHLMKYILGVTNTLCQALQIKDQDMLNAVKLVKLTDEGLKRYRLEGFDSLLEDVTSFCEKYEIEVVDMEAEYVDPRFKRKKTGITNRHHYVVNNFNTVLDMQIQELGSRFNEVTTKLLTNMSSLSPSCNFSAFSKVNLINLAEMYPCDFDFDEKEKLVYELGHTNH
ncbi:uncharacterized protein LOC143536957 [Bidens hawaiensis]|uniref:uncharacterized protein LOC143536957 n=1 Tax=Bidens hawaiensis TaxID=980011 RepID=UPI00404B1E28